MLKKQFEEVMKAFETLKKYGIIPNPLICHTCGKKFKKLDEHTYKPNCNCFRNKDLRLSIG